MSLKVLLQRRGRSGWRLWSGDEDTGRKDAGFHILVWVFETGFLCVALAVLELTL